MPLFTPLISPAIIADDGAHLVAPLTSTLIANTVYLRAFTLQAQSVIVAASYHMGATTTGKTNIGIYTLAGNLVAGSDTGQLTNVASSDTKFTYGTPILLPQGTYFIALSPSNSTDTYYSRGAGTSTAAGNSYRTAANGLSAGALQGTTGALSTTSVAPVSALYAQGGLA